MPSVALVVAPFVMELLRAADTAGLAITGKVARKKVAFIIG